MNSGNVSLVKPVDKGLKNDRRMWNMPEIKKHKVSTASSVATNLRSVRRTRRLDANLHNCSLFHVEQIYAHFDGSRRVLEIPVRSSVETTRHVTGKSPSFNYC